MSLAKDCTSLGLFHSGVTLPQLQIMNMYAPASTIAVRGHRNLEQLALLWYA